MHIYVDTSVLGGYFDLNDKSHSNIATLFNIAGNSFYGGTISIIEFESILSRDFNRFNIELEQEIESLLKTANLSQKIQIITELCMNKLNITILSNNTIEKLTFNKKEINIESISNLVWKLNADLKLRALDALQICTAVQLRIYDGIDIQYFLTNDQNILEKKEQIYQRSRIFPISSNELLTLVMIPKTEGTTKENTTHSRK